jgi:hypothetical protein
MVTFDACALHARCQPASVLLRLVDLVLVSEHYIDPAARARSLRLDRQLFCDLIDLQSVTMAVSDEIVVILCPLESTYVDRYYSLVLHLWFFLTDL